MIERTTRYWWLVLLTGVAWIAVAVISFYFVFAGTWNLVTALWTRSAKEAWWVQGATGLIELGLGFWAAGYWERSATLLVAFVGAMALLRGINEIVLAFRLQEMQSRVAALS